MDPTADITGEMNHSNLKIVLCPERQKAVVLKGIDHPTGLIRARQRRQEVLQLRLEWPVVVGWQPIQKRPPNRTVRCQLSAGAGTFVPQISPELGRTSLGFIRSRTFEDPDRFPQAHDRGMSSKREIQNRGAAMSEPTDQQQLRASRHRSDV